MIPLNKVKIDSFRLLIPFKDVTILDTTLEQKVIAQILDTGEIQELENSETKSTIFKTEQGINSRFAIHHFFNEQKELTKYLAVIVNAKMLKEQYFQGIDKTNIHNAFNFINSQGVIKIDKETFLNAKVVDVDFCVDIILKDTSVKEFVKYANQIAKPKKETNVITYTQDKNTGIQFGHRLGVGKAYLKKQFLKYYAKLVSLKYDEKNIEFYKTFIEPRLFEKTIFSDQKEHKSILNESNFIRMETTIKNKDHFKTYGKNISTLKDLIQLDIQTDYFYFLRPQMQYMDVYQKILHNENETLTDKVYYQLMVQTSNNLSMDVQDTIPFLLNMLFPYNSDDKNLKQKRNQLKKKLIDIALKRKQEILKLNNKKNQQMMFEFETKKLLPKS